MPLVVFFINNLKGYKKRCAEFLRPIVVEILFLIFHQKKIGTKAGTMFIKRENVAAQQPTTT
jgi:hypothetical protein